MGGFGNRFSLALTRDFAMLFCYVFSFHIIMFLSARWSRPSLIYCSVSSTTMPEPLSGLLITRVWSVDSSLSASCWVGVRFGVNCSDCNVFVFVLLIFFR